MSNVVDLGAFRKKTVPLVDLVSNAADHVLADWEKFAQMNRLNEFFVKTTSSVSDPFLNYVSDLNAIATLEARLGMNIVVRSPYAPGHLGWRASFPLKSGTATTPDMSFETYARCFNILLFMKVTRDLALHDMSDEL